MFADLRETLVALHREDSGEDRIDYALIAAPIALAATAGMSMGATAINDAFSLIGEKLKSCTKQVCLSFRIQEWGPDTGGPRDFHIKRIRAAARREEWQRGYISQ